MATNDGSAHFILQKYVEESGIKTNSGSPQKGLT